VSYSYDPTPSRFYYYNNNNTNYYYYYNNNNNNNNTKLFNFFRLVRIMHCASLTSLKTCSFVCMMISMHF
jgi:hypothetical protein